MDYEFDFVLTVSPFYMGEYKDAVGIQRALEKRGHLVMLNSLAPISGIRRDVNLDFNAKININFHSSYRPSRHAKHNFLFYHEVHDKESKWDVPFGIFHEFDGVFTPASEFANTTGINPLIMATDSYMFHKVAPVKEYECDVVFIGNFHQYRDAEVAKKYILPLKEKGYVVHLWGAGWDEEVYGDSVKGFLPYYLTNQVYSSAKVGLNFVTPKMIGWGLGTNRLYDMGACGLVPVSYKCPDYEWAYGDDGKMLYWANDPATAVSKVEYLLKHPRIRKTLSKRIEKHTLENHTWDTRAEDLVEVMSNPNQAFKEIPYPDTKKTGKVDLLIAIPTTLESRFAQSLAMMMSWGKSRVRTELSIYRSSFCIDDVRNQIMAYAHENHIPWTLMIDDDTCPAKEHLNMLVESMGKGFKVISGWYKNMHPTTKNYEPLIWVDNGFGQHIRLTELPKEGYIKASMVAGGFLAIHWDVINQFKINKTPMFKYLYGKPDDDPDVIKHGKIGEDRWFSQYANQMGFDLIVDTRLFCEHVKQTVVGKDDSLTF